MFTKQELGTILQLISVAQIQCKDAVVVAELIKKIQELSKREE